MSGYLTTKIHQPVMLREMLEFLTPQKNKTYVDCTFGRGGYSRAILTAANCKVIALDQDQAVETYAHELSQEFRHRFQFINKNFSNLNSILTDKVDGIIIDLGVSLMQLTDPARGFSFASDAYLDMRMDQTQGEPAEVLINQASEQNLADIIYYYGGERAARVIAKTIVQTRKVKPITTTAELVNVIYQALKTKSGKIHPATKTFQAIRIAVNKELDCLKAVLEQSGQLLNLQGKIIVVSFHSLEDSIVKQYLIQRKVAKKDPAPNAEGKFYQLLSKKPLVPTYLEVKNNPAARSAKMRAAIKVFENDA